MNISLFKAKQPDTRTQSYQQLKEVFTVGAASLTPQEMRKLADIERHLSEDKGLACRLSTMRVPGGPVAWVRHRKLALVVALGTLTTLTLLGLANVFPAPYLIWAIAAVWLLTGDGLVCLVVRACRRWEAAERAGRRTSWPIDPTQV